MTPEQQAEIQAAEARVKYARQKVYDELVSRTLTAEAAKAGAANPSLVARQVRAEVRTNDKGEEYVIAIHSDGKASDVSTAIARLKSNPEYANLFNATPTAAPTAPPQTVIVSQLSHAEYRRLRKESPHLIGLSERHVKHRR